jgi:hypothetical protein
LTERVSDRMLAALEELIFSSVSFAFGTLAS